jgi:hypothetical protein
MAEAFKVAFRAGQYVCQKIDPRHLGRVRYADTLHARVQWEDSGWGQRTPPR